MKNATVRTNNEVHKADKAEKKSLWGSFKSYMKESWKIYADLVMKSNYGRY